jgi:hypothetical protein
MRPSQRARFPERTFQVIAWLNGNWWPKPRRRQNPRWRIHWTMRNGLPSTCEEKSTRIALILPWRLRHNRDHPDNPDKHRLMSRVMVSVFLQSLCSGGRIVNCIGNWNRHFNYSARTIEMQDELSILAKRAFNIDCSWGPGRAAKTMHCDDLTLSKSLHSSANQNALTLELSHWIISLVHFLLFERPQMWIFLINHHSHHLQSVDELQWWASCLHVHNNLSRSSWIFWNFDRISYAIQRVCHSKFSPFLEASRNAFATVSDSDELELCELILDIVKSINGNQRKSSDYDIARERVSGWWYTRYFHRSAIRNSAQILSKSSIVNEFKIMGIT